MLPSNPGAVGKSQEPDATGIADPLGGPEDTDGSENLTPGGSAFQ